MPGFSCLCGICLGWVKHVPQARYALTLVRASFVGVDADVQFAVRTRLLNRFHMTKTLLLVDGSSYLYRAYHAMPNMRSAQGEPTGALYGMLNMMRRLTQDYKADWIACVFDTRGATFRDELYPEYKANRAAMPDDLAAQIEPIHTALRAMGWPVIAMEGVEADDVIATLAAQATARGVQTVVSTGDKDLAQLVNDKVTLINTMSGEVLDEEGVRNK